MGTIFSLGLNVAKKCWASGVCTIVTRKDLILGPKSNTLEKHVGKRKATKDLPRMGVKKDDGLLTKNVDT